MKVLLDINHPAHVHYFRNFIKIMEGKGHKIIVVNRNDNLINYLLDFYEIDHIIRNKRPNKRNRLLSIFYLIGMEFWHFMLSLKCKPDLYLGYTFVSRLFNKPCVGITDTEHNTLVLRLFAPYADVTLTPFYFYKNLGEKQIRFHAYMEQFYLNESFFEEDLSIFKELNIKEGEPYALFRLIAYNANHDKNVMPIPLEMKKEFVKELENKMKVFVSLESDLHDDYLNRHLVKVSPEKIHTMVKYATIFVTEGATMASEAGILGTKYIYINPLQNVGNIKQQVKDLPNIANSTMDVDAIRRIISDNNLFENSNQLTCQDKTDVDTINPTFFLVWFIENYPESKRIMKENPDYQYKFR